MKVTRVDHIGVAVPSIAEARKFFEEILGLAVTGTESIEEQKVTVAFLPLGDTEVELLEPAGQDGPVARFLEKNGPGIQHVAFRVDNLEAALAELKARGVRLIDTEPRYGAGGARIAFIHPRESHGVLVELCERREK